MLMALFYSSMSPRVSLALLLLRIVTAASFFVHGIPKLAHPMTWANGGGSPAIPAFVQLLVVIAESIGSIFLIVGFITPIVAFLQTCDMLIVTFIVQIGHRLPFVGQMGRDWELDAHLLVGPVVLLICGAGRYSIDARIAMRDLVRR